MNYVDATLLKLTDDTARMALFDEMALNQIITAAYDTEGVPLQGPFNAVFSDLQLGYVVSRRQNIEGMWGPLGAAERMEARFTTADMGEAGPVKIDALWKGGIVARLTPETGRITTVKTALPRLDTIDAEIIQALGALPSDPQILEHERRTRVIAHIRATMQQPDALTDAAFDNWLSSSKVDSVSDLLEQQGTLFADTVQVSFSPPSADPPTPRFLPITAVLLIRDATFSVSELLRESKFIRSQLELFGLEYPQDAPLKPRPTIVIVWIIPEAVFDDADWPGADQNTPPEALRAARRAAAGLWLSREGIGLVATS